MRLIAMLAVTATLASPGFARAGHPAAAPQRDEFTRLEGETLRALSVETVSFPRRAALVDRLGSAAERAPTADQRGRLALLWLESVRWLLASVPIRGADRPPYRAWLVEHRTLVMYSELAGAWMVRPDVVWMVHDAHRSAVTADEIAWFAVLNGHPGECEGSMPCYANILNGLDGEYLRRHPRGRHASETVALLRNSLDEALKLTSAPSATEFNPVGDCGELRAGLEPLRQAVVSSDGEDRSEAVGVIDRLLAHCL